MSQVYAIYGASGCGREVMPILKDSLSKLGKTLNNIYFIDDSISSGGTIHGVPVVNFDDFCKLNADEKFVNVAIAASKIREELANKLLNIGVKIFSLTANNVIKYENIEIEDGAILSSFVTLTSDIKIGKSFHANIYSYVCHDCIIGDYVTLAPAAKINGNVILEDHCYIGTGAIIKQGSPENPVVIGKGAIVGMGAVVTKSVKAGEIVVGNPARILKKS